MAATGAGAQRLRLAGLTLLVLAAHAALLSLAPPVFAPAPGAHTGSATGNAVSNPAPLRLRAVAAPAPAARPVGASATPTRAARPPTARITSGADRAPAKAADTPDTPATPDTPDAAPPAPAAPAELPATPAPVAERPQPAASATEVAVSPVADRATPLAAAAAPGAGTATATRFVIPRPARLRYRVDGVVRGQPYEASGLLDWRHDGQAYQAKMEVSLFLIGARTQTSQGQIGDAGLAPLRFGDRSRSEQATHFMRDRDQIVFSANTQAQPLQPGAQDRLSVILQLGAMIAAEPGRYPRDSSIRIQTASTREADVWVFTVLGEESLELPGGTQRGLKLLRAPRHAHDAQLELWLAPAMDYLPVRVRLTQANGDVADQRWLSTERP